MTTVRNGLTGQQLVQQAGKDMPCHLARMQWTREALKGVGLYGGAVAAIQMPKAIDFAGADRMHQSCVREGLRRRPHAREQLHCQSLQTEARKPCFCAEATSWVRA
ncbi:hypothetical protein [Streptomyces sp. NPDC050534]|uniref:hypothetical protein n=1 Tax=Streptomyces sp. NPDC050534 TaxID=3365625 RepID=UPI0037A90EFB